MEGAAKKKVLATMAITSNMDDQHDVRVFLPAPSYETVFIEIPLYQKLEVNDPEFMRNLRDNDIQFDSFCPGCEKNTTFKSVQDPHRVYGLSMPPIIDPYW
ncbi:MAG: hypothetical protein EOO38_13630, partial [Cytophagaceae bacterium]